MSFPCPSCSAPVTGSPCDSCGIVLVGPTAGRLWTVDQRIGALEGELVGLQSERLTLLAALRREPVLVAAGSGGTWTPPAHRAVPVARESSPQSVQNTLLGLGGLLLAGAGLVFAAVTYRHLGVAGRAAVLIALTALAVLATHALFRRGLTASAEALAAVSLALGGVDAWAARHAGVAEAAHASSYAAAAAALLAVTAAGWANVLPLRASRMATVLLANAPLLLVLVRLHASATATGLALAVGAGANVPCGLTGKLPKDVRAMATAASGLLTVASLSASLFAVSNGQRVGAFGLAAVAVLLAGVASLRTSVERDVLAGLSVVIASAATALTIAQHPLVAVATALVALQVAGLLQRSDRRGVVLGALAVAAAGLVAEVSDVLAALAGPITWLTQPWTLHASAARSALAVPSQSPWHGTLVTLVVLAGAAACAVAAGLLLERIQIAALPAGVLLVLSAVVLPLGLGTSYDVALGLVVLVGAALAGVGQRVRHQAGVALVATGVATLLLAGLWSLASQDATLAVLPVVAVLLGLLSIREAVLTALALIVGSSALAAFGAADGLAGDQVGGLLLAGLAVCVALTFVLRGLHRHAAEAAAIVVAGASLVLSGADPGWFSWSLAGAGIACLIVAVQKDRRLVGLAGPLLLAASSWVRLAEAHVTAPEPYVLPLALVALAAGRLRRPLVGSLEAYGAGLLLGLVPSLLRGISDSSPDRALLVLVAAVIVVLSGVRDRLRAPLVIGGVVVVIDAFDLLAPSVSALPRWLLLAVAGALLVGVGATYEQRRRDVSRIREQLATWA